MPSTCCAVGLADVPDVGVPVHGRLGEAGGAAGVEPQRPRVGVGVGDRAAYVGCGAAGGQELLPRRLADGVGHGEAWRRRPRPGARPRVPAAGRPRRPRRTRACTPPAARRSRRARCRARWRSASWRRERRPRRRGSAQDGGEHGQPVGHHQHHPVVRPDARLSAGRRRRPAQQLVELAYVVGLARARTATFVAEPVRHVAGDQVGLRVERSFILTPAGSRRSRAGPSRSAAAPRPGRRRWGGRRSSSARPSAGRRSWSRPSRARRTGGWPPCR